MVARPAMLLSHMNILENIHMLAAIAYYDRYIVLSFRAHIVPHWLTLRPAYLDSISGVSLVPSAVHASSTTEVGKSSLS